LVKENTKFKNEIDEIRKAFGNMQEIETRIRVAEMKEEKINGLLANLDQIMVRILLFSSTYNKCRNLLKIIFHVINA